MIRIGILGKIGSGKSYAAKNFGYPVFNADLEVSKLYKKDKKIYRKLKKILPNYIHSFPINKKEITKAILANKSNLRKIIKIVHLEIRKKLREMINLGFNDVYRHFNETKEGYTFWDYMRGAWQKNNGMRIDHFLVSNSLIDQVKSININKDPRGREKPSDHTPIEITLA